MTNVVLFPRHPEPQGPRPWAIGPMGMIHEFETQAEADRYARTTERMMAVAMCLLSPLAAACCFAMGAMFAVVVMLVV